MLQEETASRTSRSTSRPLCAPLTRGHLLSGRPGEERWAAIPDRGDPPRPVTTGAWADPGALRVSSAYGLSAGLADAPFPQASRRALSLALRLAQRGTP